MKLKKITTVQVVPTHPFDFNSTFHKPDHFTSGDNEWQPGIRWQTWLHEDQCLGLKFIHAGVKTKPKIKIEIYSNKKLSKTFLDSLIKEIKYRFNLDLDLKPFYQKFSQDEVLSPIIKRWQGMRPGQQNSLYEYLIIGIVLQNATVRRSIQMLQSLLENYGQLLEFDNKKLWCFWKPGSLKSVSEDDLRKLKVGYRAKSIKRTDDQFQEGLINELELRKADLETQKEKLLALYGIGPATVWYLLHDVFHHWDFFDHISPWEQKIYSKVFFNQDPENPVPVDKLLRHFQKYKPYQQLAVHYIWEDLWWKRKTQHVPWLEKLIRV